MKVLPDNRSLFNLRHKKNKLSRDSFFFSISVIGNNRILKVFLAETRFLQRVVDETKLFIIRTELQFSKRETWRFYRKCPIIGRTRSRTRMFGNLCRFQVREMVINGEYLPGVVRSGW